jgi:hypothetical protein
MGRSNDIWKVRNGQKWQKFSEKHFILGGSAF